MPQFSVWFKRENDGRAPEYAFLAQDYDSAGELSAESLKDLQRTIASVDPEDTDLSDPRALRTGDVIGDGKQFYILTPLGVWASVKAFEE